MNITVCTHVYNEAQMLPYFLRHYKTFADEIFIFVQPETNDNSREIVQDFGTGLRETPFSGCDDSKFVNWAEHTIQMMRGQADWVIWPDVDEFIMGPVRAALETCTAPIVRPGHGWNMIHDRFPTTTGQIYDEVKRGIPEPGCCKPIIVRPGHPIGWQPGKHNASAGDFVLDALTQLHFRNLGIEYHLGRNARNWARVTLINKALGHGYHTAPEYAEPEKAIFAKRLLEAVEVTWDEKLSAKLEATF